MIRWRPLKFAHLLGLLLVLLLLPPHLSQAQTSAPEWQVAVGIEGPTIPLIRSVVTDSAGNVFLAGSFRGNMLFGTVPLSSRSAEDIFIAKWSRTTQRFVWAQRAGGTERDLAVQLAIQGSTLYVTGSCQSPTYDFGPLQLRSGSSGNSQAYVAKLLDEGATSQFVWAQPLGKGQAGGSALAVQGSVVFVTGSYYGPLVFPEVTLPNANLPAYGTTDLYVVKLLDEGPAARFAWAQRAGGFRDDDTRAIAVMGDQVYLAGAFTSPTASFGSLHLVNAKPEANTTDAFVAKLVDEGTHGTFVWARQAGGWFHDRFNALAVRGNNVYVAGFLGTSVDFGPFKAPNAGTLDLVVAKLTDTGSSAEFTWVQTAGGPGYEQAQAMVVQDNQVYVTGEVNGGRAVFGKHRLTHELGAHVFVTRLTDFGQASSFDWVQQAGGEGNSEVYALAVHRNSLYVGGFSHSPSWFGSIHLRNSSGGAIAFVGSLTDSIPPVANNTELTNRLEVYPNPAQTTLWVRVPPLVPNQPVSLTLVDALGRKVYQQTVVSPAPNGVETIPLAGIAAGLYQLSIQAGQRRVAHRVVVD